MNIDQFPAQPTATPVGTPPPFDPELDAALTVLRRQIPTTVPSLDMIPALRRQAAEWAPPPSNEQISRDGAFVVTERTAPGPAGAPEIPLLICRPAEAATPVAAVYYIHGGGMIGGTHRMIGVDPLLDMATELGLAVVSVDYRLAPEHPHPAPVEDCYAGLLWTVEHAADLGIDPSRLLVAGPSAGGGLAAAVVLLARDRKGPALAGQLLNCPLLDDRNNTPSSLQMAGLDVWDHARNEMGWTALLGEQRGGLDVSPYAAPARATDLSGLPPAFIDVGSAETFRDEGVTYATRIWQAGGKAELHVWPGGFHGFDVMVPQAMLSQDAKTARLRWLRRTLAL
ncbi:alpha/beta hydrolase [Nonomuraea sp. NPDC049725]|uniref:alpha/beta hydrolase n=1 Tax=Nonomuraea sp. NPDC049725 TaxID=3154508 RepID=UPI003449756D